MWFRKGKNLFDINNIFNILYSNGEIVSNQNWGMSEFIEVLGNTKYTISSTLISGQTAGQLQINEFDKNKNFITNTFKNTTLLEFTTGANTKYLRVGYRVDRQENIMLEQGDYTSYEAYIEPQIFVKNSNGVYEEFIKKDEVEEVKITSLINGATLNNGWQNKLFRMGNLCHLELAFVPNTTNDIAIYQIPARFAPRMSTIGLLMRNNLIGKSIITTSNNGQIKIQVPSNSNVTWELNATWFI